MTKSEFDTLVHQAKQELRDRSARPHLRLYVSDTKFGSKTDQSVAIRVTVKRHDR